MSGLKDVHALIMADVIQAIIDKYELPKNEVFSFAAKRLLVSYKKIDREEAIELEKKIPTLKR